MHIYAFNSNTYNKTTRHLNNEEDIAYRRLLDLYYDTEEPICLDKHLLARRLQVGVYAIEVVINEFFYKTEDGYRNHYADRVISKHNAFIAKQRENGKKGGRPKKTRIHPNILSNKPKENPVVFSDTKPTDNPLVICQNKDKNHSLKEDYEANPKKSEISENFIPKNPTDNPLVICENNINNHTVKDEKIGDNCEDFLPIDESIYIYNNNIYNNKSINARAKLKTKNVPALGNEEDQVFIQSPKKKHPVVTKPEEVDKQVWEDFLYLRKQKSSPITVTALSMIKNQAQSIGWTLNQALEECILRGWRGFRADWVKDKVTPREVKNNSIAALTSGLATNKSSLLLTDEAVSTDNGKLNTNNFCSEDDGFDYIFMKMLHFYGNSFLKKWEGLDASLIRQMWKKELGEYLTYRPILDTALRKMHPAYPPAVLDFLRICKESGNLPQKILPKITRKKTEEEEILSKNVQQQAFSSMRKILGRTEINA